MSRLLFAWVVPLFKKGYRKELNFTDLYRYCTADDPKKATEVVEKNWYKELKKDDPSIVRALVRSFGFQYTLIAFICLLTVS